MKVAGRPWFDSPNRDFHVGFEVLTAVAMKCNRFNGLHGVISLKMLLFRDFPLRHCVQGKICGPHSWNRGLFPEGKAAGA
jgi:hypothetical protein